MSSHLYRQPQSWKLDGRDPSPSVRILLIRGMKPLSIDQAIYLLSIATFGKWVHFPLWFPGSVPMQMTGVLHLPRSYFASLKEMKCS